jgi:surfactin synthase thioesterase subunit
VLLIASDGFIYSARSAIRSSQVNGPLSIATLRFSSFRQWSLSISHDEHLFASVGGAFHFAASRSRSFVWFAHVFIHEIAHCRAGAGCFGHSLGAHVAFELARKIRNHNKPLPRGLLASGSRAPHLPLRRKPLHQLPTPELIGELRRYGGTPEAVLQNQELMDLFLPPLRADLCVFETMEYEAGVPFDFPIAAFGGRTDHRTDLDEIEAWREHTTGRFTVEFFEGGHFYLMEQSKTVFSAALRQTITDLV